LTTLKKPLYLTYAMLYICSFAREHLCSTKFCTLPKTYWCTDHCT